MLALYGRLRTDIKRICRATSLAPTVTVATVARGVKSISKGNCLRTGKARRPPTIFVSYFRNLGPTCRPTVFARGRDLLGAKGRQAKGDISKQNRSANGRLISPSTRLLGGGEGLLRLRRRVRGEKGKGVATLSPGLPFRRFAF